MAPGGERPAVLEVRDLCVELGIGGKWIRALHDVSLTIRGGETLGLVGESGSGKSLTALSIPGLLPGNARVVGGSIRLMGEDVLGKSEPELNRLRDAVAWPSSSRTRRPISIRSSPSATRSPRSSS